MYIALYNFYTVLQLELQHCMKMVVYEKFLFKFIKNFLSKA